MAMFFLVRLTAHTRLQTAHWAVLLYGSPASGSEAALPHAGSGGETCASGPVGSAHGFLALGLDLGEFQRAVPVPTHTFFLPTFSSPGSRSIGVLGFV